MILTLERQQAIVSPQVPQQRKVNNVIAQRVEDEFQTEQALTRQMGQPCSRAYVLGCRLAVFVFCIGFWWGAAKLVVAG